MYCQLFSNDRLHSISLNFHCFFAGGKQDILLPTGPTSHGVPGVGSMASMPFGHGDATYIQRQQARER